MKCLQRQVLGRPACLLSSSIRSVERCTPPNSIDEYHHSLQPATVASHTRCGLGGSRSPSPRIRGRPGAPLRRQLWGNAYARATTVSVAHGRPRTSSSARCCGVVVVVIVFSLVFHHMSSSGRVRGVGDGARGVGAGDSMLLQLVWWQWLVVLAWRRLLCAGSR